ncbi:MAG: type I glyceraldehyde-3-phosphate dehydrogenase [Mycoplasma sp.]
MNKNIKIAINGFGRIGRLTFRQLWDNKNVEIVAINDLTDPATLAYLLEFDSAQGGFKRNKISSDGKDIIVEGEKVAVFAEKDPTNLPWGKLGVDIVIESTGIFTSEEKANVHIKAGAKKVVISAPAKGKMKTIVFNVNHKELTPTDVIISAASCTTNCLAPVAHALHTEFGLKHGNMLTVHSVTNDQRILDLPHSDYRRGRSGFTNIIPTTTGAAAAVGLVLPQLKGKLDGIAMRVPTITGSVVYLSCQLDKKVTAEEINSAIKKHSSETLAYCEKEIVSSDIIGETHGSIFDSKLTKVMDNNGEQLVQIVSWYDNEASYVNQLIRTTLYFAGL